MLSNVHKCVIFIMQYIIEAVPMMLLQTIKSAAWKSNYKKEKESNYVLFKMWRKFQ